MKVRVSQIPEESGKPKYQKKMKTTTKKAKDFDDEEDDDDFGEEPEEDEPKRLKKTMINFREEGIVISAYDLNCIEKDMRFVEKPTAHWEFGITINKGLNPGQFINKTDLSMWYIKEEVRDRKWEKLMELLKLEGLNVIEVQ